MIEKFEHSGVSFQYPANWSIEFDVDGDDWNASVQSPATPVLMVTHSKGGDPAAMADEALESLEEDYDELDSEIAIEKLAGQTAVGHDIDILTLDTPVVVKVRALATKTGGLLLLWQFSERDRDHYEPVFHAIVASITLK